ncbi:helix-turn-helix domain-containing protein [Streptomyces sp. TRM49041]|uniref:helix-turn-helix domain-containing protein n=1 Tax=Streptomyces sp. TRM49041 TaxID=2603216 RepID=UPI0011ED1D09|nr:helix-turn-helix domain-containing protein [Streptomyces sp. TRM49041]
MRIHRTTRTRNFTTVGNELLRDPNISFVAAGVLVYLLSLPEAACVDIRTLAKRRREGRTRIGRALHELEAAGYLRRESYQDPRTGYWLTTYDVYDTPFEDSPAAPTAPAAPAAPPPVREPAPGNPDAGDAGALPPVEKTGVQEPPSPSPTPSRAVQLLTSLGRREPRLAAGEGEMAKLGPLVEEWFAVGATETAVREALTAGLPDPVYAPAALLADRLKRKKPAPRPEAPVRQECPDCGRPTRPGGPCRHGAAPPGPSLPAPVAAFVAATGRGAAMTREALRRAADALPGAEASPGAC